MSKAGRVCLFLFLVNVLLGSGVARAEMVDRIVAVVNNDVILYSELQQQIKAIKKLSPRFNNLSPDQERQLQRQVLQQMIQEELTEQQIKKLKIVVTSHDVDQAIAGIKRENGLSDDQLQYMLHQQGKTMKDFRQSIRKDLERARLIERVFKSKTVITDQQIDAYLKSSAGSEGQARLRLALIFLPLSNDASTDQVNKIQKMAETIHEQLQEGANFANLAKQYSQGPAADEGGDIGYIPADELAPPIEKATRDLKVNGVTDPIRTPQGYYIVKILDAKRSRVSVDSAKAREKARRELMQKAVDKEFAAWMKDLEAKSFIQINL